MRGLLFALVMLLASAASPVMAAPTCRDANGGVARCGTPNAMPLGWQLSDDEYHRRQAAIGNVFDPWEVLNAIMLVAGLFAIVALLPDFDGSRDSDWDEQEGDKRPRS